MQERIAYRGLTFDDVLLEPGYSDVMPSDVDISSSLSSSCSGSSSMWNCSPTARSPMRKACSGQ